MLLGSTTMISLTAGSERNRSRGPRPRASSESSPTSASRSTSGARRSSSLLTMRRSAWSTPGRLYARVLGRDVVAVETDGVLSGAPDREELPLDVHALASHFAHFGLDQDVDVRHGLPRRRGRSAHVRHRGVRADRVKVAVVLGVL